MSLPVCYLQHRKSHSFTIFFIYHFFHNFSWDEGVSLALGGHPSGGVVAMKIHDGVDASLHQPALHSIFSSWVH